MGKTTIEWTDRSVNPIRAKRTWKDADDSLYESKGHYCEKLSSGCANCYASRFQSRLLMPKFPGASDGKLPDDIEVFFDHQRLEEVLKRKEPTRWFWCDMTDMFGWWVEAEWLDKMFAVMAMTPHHTHQILTKRPELMLRYLSGNRSITGGIAEGYCAAYMIWQECQKLPGEAPFGWVELESEQKKIAGWPLPNVHLGVSAEDQKDWDLRVPMLEKCPAAVRFVSVEPMLGSIDAREQFFASCDGCDGSGGYFPSDPQEEEECRRCEGAGVDEAFPMEEIHWIICGGESGPNARVFDPQNAYALMTQCRTAGIPFFFKQMGSNPYDKFNDQRIKIVDSKGHAWKGSDYDELKVRMFPGDEWPK